MLARDDSVLYFPPEAFGPFRVLHQIGAGALGPVFRAHEPGRERLVAIKVFRLDITPGQADTLVHELEQLIALDITHRAVAAPIAAGLDGHAVYLAVEYVVGDSLDIAVRDAGRMPLGDVANVVEGMASAIDACGERGVHHRLLHPRDVIMSADGPRIAGFGIGDALTRIGLQLPVRRPYAPPEGASDVYSLAAIAYELISGRRMTPTGWDELSAEDGPELRGAFAAALSPDPRERPARAGEFAAKLRSAAESSATPVAQLVTPPVVEPVFRPTVEPDLTASTTPVDIAVALPPMPASWTAQPPRAFLTEELTPPPARRTRLIVLALVALALAGAAAYGVWGRRGAPPAAARQVPAEPPAAAATTVDVPPAASMPPEPALPAPTPSRPASGATSVAAAATGRLLIRSTPADAIVTINGQARGKTPLTVRELALGSYTIRVARVGFIEVDRRVQLTARRPSESIEVALKAAPAPSTSADGGLTFESRPPGARVFVNDRLVGSTPLTMSNLPAGPATVRIEMDGYQGWTTTVRVIAGEQTRVGASLERK